MVTVASATVCTSRTRKNGDSTLNGVPEAGNAPYSVVRSASRVVPSKLPSAVAVHVPVVNLTAARPCTRSCQTTP